MPVISQPCITGESRQVLWLWFAKGAGPWLCSLRACGETPVAFCSRVSYAVDKCCTPAATLTSYTEHPSACETNWCSGTHRATCRGTFNMAILHRPSRLDVNQPDLPVFRPAVHAPRGELWPIVRAHVLWTAVLGNQPIHPALASRDPSQSLCQLIAPCTHACMHPHQRHAPPRQPVDGEVHRPLLVRFAESRLNSTLACQTLALLAPHHQAFYDIQPIDALHVHLVITANQQYIQPTIAIARPCRARSTSSLRNSALQPDRASYQ